MEMEEMERTNVCGVHPVQARPGRPTRLERVLREVARERARQEGLHPGETAAANISFGKKLAILGEEYGEACREAYICMAQPPSHVQAIEARPNLRSELIQVAAVAVAWAESLE